MKGRQGLNTLSLQELMNQPQGRVKGAPRVVNKWPQAVRGRPGSVSQPLHAQDRVAEGALRDGLACPDTSVLTLGHLSLYCRIHCFGLENSPVSQQVKRKQTL